MPKFTIKRWLNYGLFAFLLLSLQGCALQLLEWGTPKEGYQLKENIPYGSHKRQRLDLYTPETPNEKAITLVFFYGGAWQRGNKEYYRFVAQAFAEKGYPVIVADYRVYPDVLFPDFINDAALAVKWVAAQTDHSIVLMGHSAGAHIAALLALDDQYLTQVDVEKNRIAGWVGLSGPYDFLPLKSERLKTIFNGAEDINDTQPINFVSSTAPPALLIHGTEDTRVLPRNTQRLTTALTEKGVAVTTKYYPGKHAITVAALWVPFRSKLPVLDDIENFLSGL